MKLVLLSLTILLTFNVLGAGLDLENSETTSYLTNRPLSVSGEFKPVRKNDQISKLKRLRKKLEKRNEENVKKQIEKIRYMNELKMMKKIENAFNETVSKLDQ